MKTKVYLILGIIGLAFTFCKSSKNPDASAIVGYTVNLQNQDLQFYWKNSKGENYKSFSALKADLKTKDKTLLFAMNGGMYQEDLRPLGLYIEKGEVMYPLNKVANAYGNFYLQPNGIFYITRSKEARIIPTTKFKSNDNIQFATQSGPMLLIDGAFHPKIKKGSTNLNIRNGVGILPNGDVHFAISTEPINFYDFASYFSSMGCKNALYLDGFVSKTYLPSIGLLDLGGQFGVIIAEVK